MTGKEVAFIFVITSVLTPLFTNKYIIPFFMMPRINGGDRSNQAPDYSIHPPFLTFKHHLHTFDKFTALLHTLVLQFFHKSPLSQLYFDHTSHLLFHCLNARLLALPHSVQLMHLLLPFHNVHNSYLLLLILRPNSTLL